MDTDEERGKQQPLCQIHYLMQYFSILEFDYRPCLSVFIRG